MSDIFDLDRQQIVLESDQLRSLLCDFGLEELFSVLTAHGITFDCLQYLSKDDIRDAIKNIGLRAKFREKLFVWRKQFFNIDDTTVSTDSKVTGWLESDDLSPSPKSLISQNSPFEILYLLKQSAQGQTLLQHYKKHLTLSKLHRDALISIIIEHSLLNKLPLKTSDFPQLVQQIVSIFPSECAAKDYYFIPRQGKKNPSGKLYFKYTNCKSKHFKSSLQLNVEYKNDVEDEFIEFDQDVSSSLKEELRRSIANWDVVRDKWVKSYHIRRHDLKNLSPATYLENWPKYMDARGYELIKIDFNILFPKKEHSLFSKWTTFKSTITHYYADYIKNNQCKNLFSKLKHTTDIDSEDFLVAILLCSVLQQNGRSKNKKVPIIDAQDSFIFHLVCINDYQRSIDELTNKYFESGKTIQPFLIVEGLSVTTITSFYIYFDKVLYKLNSLLEALDVCFQMFHVFDLKYPTTCEHVWSFIQYYFYEIHTAHDIKSSNVTSILSFLNS